MSVGEVREEAICPCLAPGGRSGGRDPQGRAYARLAPARIGALIMYLASTAHESMSSGCGARPGSEYSALATHGAWAAAWWRGKLRGMWLPEESRHLEQHQASHLHIPPLVCQVRLPHWELHMDRRQSLAYSGWMYRMMPVLHPCFPVQGAGSSTIVLGEALVGRSPRFRTCEGTEQLRQSVFTALTQRLEFEEKL